MHALGCSLVGAWGCTPPLALNRPLPPAPWPGGCVTSADALCLTCTLPPRICDLRARPLHGVEDGRRCLNKGAGEHVDAGGVGRSRRPPLPLLSPLRGVHGRGEHPAPLPDLVRTVALWCPSNGLIASGGDDVFLQEFQTKALPAACVEPTPTALSRCCLSSFEVLL